MGDIAFTEVLYPTSYRNSPLVIMMRETKLIS